MFDIGFTELVLLAVIGLVVLGPKRLPKVAGEIGRWVGRARRTLTDLRRELEREAALMDRPAQPSRPTLRVVSSSPTEPASKPSSDTPTG
jgi:sec-independent protein translocase protein TatB